MNSALISLWHNAVFMSNSLTLGDSNSFFPDLFCTDIIILHVKFSREHNNFSFTETSHVLCSHDGCLLVHQSLVNEHC